MSVVSSAFSLAFSAEHSALCASNNVGYALLLGLFLQGGKILYPALPCAPGRSPTLLASEQT
jgi:hypothetical protein